MPHASYRRAVCADTLCLSPERILNHAGLVIEKGRVLEIAPRQELANAAFPVEDFGPRSILPAPVNCHTHLELSHLKGRTQLGQGFTVWAQSLFQVGMGNCDRESLQTAVGQLQACGTARVFDVSSRAPLAVVQALEAAGQEYAICGELFGFAPLPEEALPLPQMFLDLPPEYFARVCGAGHALYSTSAQRLQRARTWSEEQDRPFFLHLAEHEEEDRLLLDGSGSLAALLQGLVLPRGWEPPGKRPVALAHELGLLGPGSVAVHCVRLSDEDVALLADSGATVCLCPRSNAAIGVGQAPVAALLTAGVPCCLGTDSLASNRDLDIWAELRHVLQLTRATLTLGQVVLLTSGAASMLPGMAGLGRLEPGCPAVWSLLPEWVEELVTT